MRSFDLVDFKVAEADFFLKKLRKESEDFTTARFYLSAFVSAARSITFSIRAVLGHIDGFEDWYQTRQSTLKADGLAEFFVAARNVSQKTGELPIEFALSERLDDGTIRVKWFFPESHPEFKRMPAGEVADLCCEYLRKLVTVVYDCYVDWGTEIDPDQYYTKENFQRFGRSIDDADEEVIGIRGWTHVEGIPEAYRWQALRDQMPGCRIDHLFEEYLGKQRPSPLRLPDVKRPVEGSVWIPPSLRKTDDPKEDYELYVKNLKTGRGP